MRSRTVCQAISGWPRPSSSISPACTLRPSAPSEASVPAAPPNSPTSTRGRSCSSRSRWRCDRGEQRRALKPKVSGTACCRLLRPGHRRVAVALRQVGERGRDRLHVLLDQVERRADLHDGRGVGDVLGGRAPMAPFAEPVVAEADDLLHHAEDRIADALGLLLELGEVDVLDAGTSPISRAASSGMMPSRACTRASAASISR